MTLAYDLFGGAGGTSLGLVGAGFTVVAWEKDRDAITTHRAAGMAVVYADLSSYSWRNHPEVDHVHGSPPCQPFSAAGSHAGKGDRRDGMPWMVRAISELYPRVATIENVPGLLYAKHRPYFDHLIASIIDMGYDVEWRVLNAADYGVPQTRKRVIVIARRDGVTPKWPDPTHAKGGAGGLTPWVSMAEALGWQEDDLVGFPRRNDQPTEDEYRTRDLFPAGGPAQHVTEKGRSWSRFVLQPGSWADGRGGNRRTYDLDEPAPTVVPAKDAAGWRWRLNTGRDWKKGEDRDAAQTIDADNPAPAVSSVLTQWWWTRPSTTVAGDYRIFPPGGHQANDGRDNSKMLPRSTQTVRVSLDELATLQGFPAGYPFHGTRTSRARQIGNALPAIVLQRVAEVNR